ncbi:hypothetical protein DZC75_13280 [Pseudomonas parafulva]|uniref:Uncharacterized protein n=1 Tax=Pseudomonas parafulva TaxID=157782 RepID=A0AAI8KD10_9PSED|nr:hypothetical protein [Pseudomonas parafulva]AIZ33301.1 hypothetical protein NJ69_10060 [Pseudomonas parafulva]AXO88923.1 hypothetical protein DZC75_13280 [Pseudomonas parafulva]
MLNTNETRVFIRRFGWVILLAHILVMATLAVTWIITTPVPWRGHEHVLKVAFFATVFGGVVMGLAFMLVVRGRSWGVWINVVLLVLCMALTLAFHAPGHGMAILGVALMLPLLALLVINSGRHRQAVKRYAVFRRDRTRWAMTISIAKEKGIDLNQEAERLFGGASVERDH